MRSLLSSIMLLALLSPCLCRTVSRTIRGTDDAQAETNIKDIFMGGDKDQSPAVYGGFVQHNYIGGDQLNYYYQWSQLDGQQKPGLANRFSDTPTGISLEANKPNRAPNVVAPPVSRPKRPQYQSQAQPQPQPQPQFQPPSPQEQSTCLRAIIQCCPTYLKNGMNVDRCLETNGCPGPFWDNHPCDLANGILEGLRYQ